MSKKKWGKSAARHEKIVRDAIPKPETLEEIDNYISKARSITVYDIAHRFGIRLSTARKLLREKEAQGMIVPYIRESGFVVYTTPSELENKDSKPIVISDVLEEVATFTPSETFLTDEMEAELALAAAEAIRAVKPSKMMRRRREAGTKKERAKDRRPEVIVEPLEKKETEVKAEEKPKKKTTKKKTEVKAEEKPKKKTTKKKTEAEAEEKPKKKTTKKKAESEKAEEKPKKKTTKKKSSE
ncbi:MAG: 40S ribosomal protein S25 [Candidatus Thorarchaeota archaeon]|nr:40S ribosomal protein S25 [Candidatus Thorarchaeota archaeon]